MRLFVAIWPPAPVIELLAGIERPLTPGLRWTTEDQWHVTLRFLGEVAGDDRGKTTLDVLESIGRNAPATARAGPAVVPLGPTVLCLPVAGLDDLAADVGRATADIAAPVGKRPFRGHLTVARLKDGVRVPSSAWAALSASWKVDEVTLVASQLRPNGAHYEAIGRIPLAG
jgi:2'-5' RNA ligase